MNSPNLYNRTTERIVPDIAWDTIDKVFLDMDGTLLDKHYDDYFWEHYVPQVYAAKNNVDHTEARKVLLDTYRSVQNTLLWTDLDYWSEQLGLNIAHMKQEVSHLVDIRPHALEFLKHLRKIGKKTYLVTNAHPEALTVKMNRVDIRPWFEKMICSKEVGAAKEQPEFWEKLQELIPYEKAKTLFADDTEKVLDSAREYGMGHLIHIAEPSSKLPLAFSSVYPSIANFEELISQEQKHSQQHAVHP